jgi:CTP synthase
MLDKQKCEISAVSTQEQLPEAMESLVHPWFVGVQFHPEYKSRCWQPHPVFVSFLAACMNPENQP